MNKVCLISFLSLLLSLKGLSQTGVDCSTSKLIPIDGVARNYSTSTATAAPIICTGYSGTTPVTYFSFTTNSTADKILMNITAPTAEPCEIILYSSNCTIQFNSSSMCFDDGSGLWSFSHAFVISPSTTYKLRIRTTTSGNINIAASFYNPVNNSCAGATAIGSVPIQDNNACNVGATGINPADLCASSLENTAFYKYAVETDGVSIVNINNVNCDNGAFNNSNGFQIGFFTGSCSSLTPISCYAGSGSFVTASTVSLPAGTEVFVAIDGISGSNCRYDISVINGNILAATIGEFSGWKEINSNFLKWTSYGDEAGEYYEIQRSENRRDFVTIGRVNCIVTASGESSYNFEDNRPGITSYYRLRVIHTDGKTSLSKIIEMRRDKAKGIKMDLINPAFNLLSARLTLDKDAAIDINIFNQSGQSLSMTKMDCKKGVNQFTKPLNGLPAGQYYVVIRGQEIQAVSPFIKMN